MSAAAESSRAQRARNNFRLIENLESRLLMSVGGGSFGGVGAGSTLIRESFGFAQGTRYKQNGSIKDVAVHTNINGIRAEFPNSKTETWIAPPETPGGQEWDFAVVGPADPYEPFTPLQNDSLNHIYSDGILFLNGASFLDGTPDQRPNALLPFAAPTTSAYTVRADSVGFFDKTAIGFTSSSAVNQNFETSGQAWLEIDTTGNFPAGGSTFINTFVFHTNGLSGPSVSGTFQLDPTGFNRMAVSYDPVKHVASAMLNGVLVASLPYNLTAAVSYVGVEGSWNGNVDNFSVTTGSVANPAPRPLTATAAGLKSTFSTRSIASDLFATSFDSVL